MVNHKGKEYQHGTYGADLFQPRDEHKSLHQAKVSANQGSQAKVGVEDLVACNTATQRTSGFKGAVLLDRSCTFFKQEQPHEETCCHDIVQDNAGQRHGKTNGGKRKGRTDSNDAQNKDRSNPTDKTDNLSEGGAQKTSQAADESEEHKIWHKRNDEGIGER